MIYPSKERAEHWASKLNERKGHYQLEVWLSPAGWTLIHTDKLNGEIAS
jgi:hypothetical protein